MSTRGVPVRAGGVRLRTTAQDRDIDRRPARQPVSFRLLLRLRSQFYSLQPEPAAEVDILDPKVARRPPAQMRNLLHPARPCCEQQRQRP